MESKHGLEDLLWSEDQSFCSKGAWVVVLAVFGLTVGVMLWGMYNQIFLGVPSACGSMGDGMLVLTTGVVVLVSTGVLVTLVGSRLTIRAFRDGLSVSFFPFWWAKRWIPYTQLREAKFRVYRPIREFGGWGLRCNAEGRAYNVRGKQGVQLVFQDGQRLLLGSQRARELEAVIGRQLGARPTGQP